MTAKPNKRVLLLGLVLPACVMSELPAEDVCKEFGYTISARVMACTGDANAANDAYDKFTSAYKCEVDGYGENELQQGVILLNDGTQVMPAQAYGCAGSIRQQATCERLASGAYDQIMGTVDPLCSQIMSGDLQTTNPDWPITHGTSHLEGTFNGLPLSLDCTFEAAQIQNATHTFNEALAGGDCFSTAAWSYHLKLLHPEVGVVYTQADRTLYPTAYDLVLGPTVAAPYGEFDISLYATSTELQITSGVSEANKSLTFTGTATFAAAGAQYYDGATFYPLDYNLTLTFEATWATPAPDL